VGAPLQVKIGTIN